MISERVSKDVCYGRLVKMLGLLAILLGLLIVEAPGVESVTSAEADPTQQCPTWLEEAPPLGPGQPRAVGRAGLASLLICRYHGNPNSATGSGLPPNNRIEGEKTIVRRRGIVRLAGMVDELAPYPKPGPGGILCPTEFSGGFYLVFSYSDGRKASVEVVPTGCQRAVAGKNRRWLALSPALRRQLESEIPSSS